MAARGKQPSADNPGASIAGLVLEVTQGRDVGRRGMARLCESAVPLASTSEQRQSLAVRGAILFSGYDSKDVQRSIKLWELAAGIEGPLTARAAVGAGQRYLSHCSNEDGRLFAPDKAIQWFNRAIELLEPHTRSADEGASPGINYVAALDGLVRVHTSPGSEAPDDVVVNLVERIATEGREGLNREVRDRARWTLEGYTQGGCGSVAANRAKELLVEVGAPSNYVEGLMASV